MFSQLAVQTKISGIFNSVLNQPSIAGTLSMTIPSSPLVPVMVVVNLDCAEFSASIGRKQLVLIKNVVEMLISQSDHAVETCVSPISPETSFENKLGCTGSSGNFQKFTLTFIFTKLYTKFYLNFSFIYYSSDSVTVIFCNLLSNFRKIRLNSPGLLHFFLHFL